MTAAVMSAPNANAAIPDQAHTQGMMIATSSANAPREYAVDESIKTATNHTSRNNPTTLENAAIHINAQSPDATAIQIAKSTLGRNAHGAEQ